MPERRLKEDSFMTDNYNTNNPDVRNKCGTKASYIGIILNILLVIGKGIGGIMSGSVSVIADALNNLTDVAGSLILLIGFKVSGKKADKKHPFGHGRSEYISGLAVAVLILIVGIELGKNSFNKILYPTPVEFGWLTLLILFVSVLLKLWMARFTKNLGKKINSTALATVSSDSRNDVITTSAVLISALISRFGTVNLDGWAGFGIALFIIYNSISLIKETISPLLGESPVELIDSITRKIKTYDGVLGIHDVVVHDYGPGRRHASAHVELSGNIDPMVSHELIDGIEKYFLQEENIHLVIHYDPVKDDLNE